MFKKVIVTLIRDPLPVREFEDVTDIFEEGSYTYFSTAEGDYGLPTRNIESISGETSVGSRTGD